MWLTRVFPPLPPHCVHQLPLQPRVLTGMGTSKMLRQTEKKTNLLQLVLDSSGSQQKQIL